MAQRRGVATAPEATDNAAPSGQQTLSQLVARILDQLSVSAWLPAGALVFLLLLIANLQISHGNVHAALGNVAEINLVSLVLLLGAVVLTTVLTQAFEFEAIRLLEGYWGPGRLSRLLADWGSRRHLARLHALTERQSEVRRRAFPHARLRMLEPERDIPLEVVDIIEARFTGRTVDSATQAHLREADSISFMDHAPLNERRRYYALVAALDQYPPEHLVLPTRLGNTLRSYERSLRGTKSGSLQNFVREIFHELPLPMQIEHDQFRSRLDLYCSLLVVFALSGLIGAGVLATLGIEFSAATAGVALLLAGLSYRAAVASAREYGRVLRAIADFRAHSCSSE
jgi:DNA-binding GntR family transcriptional regulator